MALVAEPTLLSGPAIHAAQAPRAAFRHLWHDDYVKYISGECAKVWVRVVVLDWQQAPSPVTTARPPSESSPLRRQPVVAPPPPAPPEDTRAVVLKVIAGENGLARLRPPPVSLSSVAFPLNRSSSQCSEVHLRRGCCISNRQNRCEFGVLLRAAVVYYAGLDFSPKVRRVRGEADSASLKNP